MTTINYNLVHCTSNPHFDKSTTKYFVLLCLTPKPIIAHENLSKQTNVTKTASGNQ